MKTAKVVAGLITLLLAAGGVYAQDRMRTEGDSSNASNKLSQPASRSGDGMSRTTAPTAPSFDRMRTEGDSAQAANNLSQPDRTTARTAAGTGTKPTVPFDRMRAEGDSSSPENKLSQPR